MKTHFKRLAMNLWTGIYKLRCYFHHLNLNLWLFSNIGHGNNFNSYSMTHPQILHLIVWPNFVYDLQSDIFGIIYTDLICLTTALEVLALVGFYEDDIMDELGWAENYKVLRKNYPGFGTIYNLFVLGNGCWRKWQQEGNLVIFLFIKVLIVLIEHLICNFGRKICIWLLSLKIKVHTTILPIQIVVAFLSPLLVDYDLIY